MARISCDFNSEVLGLATSMTVLLPEPGLDSNGHPLPAHEPYRVLWLLHGRSDDHTMWTRRTSIERYATDHGIAVVMPSVDRSFYIDMVQGHRYGTFIREELPAKARRFFPLSSRRDDNFVAGLSMGGYGAFLLALSQPDRFAAAASLSGALDMATRAGALSEDDDGAAEIRRVFGPPEDVRGSDHDLLALAARAVEAGHRLPRLYAWCGTEDFLWDDNLAFRDHARQLEIPLTWEEGPGDHSWGYWDRGIERVLQWMRD